MRLHAWAWCLAFDALLLTLTPMAGMSGVLGIEPMSVARADTLWGFALILVGAAFGLWNRAERSQQVYASARTSHRSTIEDADAGGRGEAYAHSGG